MKQDVTPHVTIKLVDNGPDEHGQKVGFQFEIEASNSEMMLILGAYVSQIERMTGLDINEIIYFLRADHKMKSLDTVIEVDLDNIGKAVDQDGKT